MKKLKNKTTLFLFIIFICCLLSYVFVYFSNIKSEVITSDSQGYYAYLPAFLIYQDFSMQRKGLYHPEAESLTYPAIYLNNKTNRFVSKYPVGIAVLLLPFFVIAHLTALALNLPATGYSFIYQHTVGVAGVFYLLFGAYYLSKALSKYFKHNAVFLTIVALIFGTNLFHYATYESLMSHIFSFFLVSVFLYILLIWQERPNIKSSLKLGFLAGLIFLARNLNIIILLLLIPYINRKNVRFLFLSFLILLLTILPQLLYWQYAAGEMFYYSYPGESFNFLDPRIKGFLLSYRRGLLFWSPIFLFTIFGLYKLKSKIGSLMHSIFLVLGVYIFFASSWGQWAYGSGFGNRALIDIYPLLSFMMANFYEKIYQLKNIKNLVFLLTALFIMLNITNMIKYWNGILPPDHITLDLYLKNLFKLK
jgi:hypothetical protein